LGVDYLSISVSVETVKQSVLLPVALLSAGLAVLITWQNWWKALL
jgi:hypothetical protein